MTNRNRETNVTKPEPSNGHRAALLLFLVSLAAAAGVVTAAAAADPPPAPPPPPAAPAPPAAPTTHDADTDLDAQLEAARRNLEQAAREVARLSAQLSGSVIDSVAPYFTPRAIIGVQLEHDGTAGARVREVSPGGPAAEAGIRAGDVLVSVNGTELTGEEPARQVVRIMREVKPDSKVRVRVLRDGKSHEYVITARAGPAVVANLDLPDLPGLPQLRGAFMLHRPLTDMELATLTPRLGSYFGTDKGVLVVRAPADGALKLEDGDVILAIDGREPTSGSHATRILGSYQPGEKITLRILRQHKTLEVQATLPERPAHAHPERRADRDAIYFDKDALRLDDVALGIDRYLQSLWAP
jgi:predicted metalloprotease with PDZ domain